MGLRCVVGTPPPGRSIHRRRILGAPSPELSARRPRARLHRRELPHGHRLPTEGRGIERKPGDGSVLAAGNAFRDVDTTPSRRTCASRSRHQAVVVAAVPHSRRCARLSFGARDLRHSPAHARLSRAFPPGRPGPSAARYASDWARTLTRSTRVVPRHPAANDFWAVPADDDNRVCPSTTLHAE